MAWRIVDELDFMMDLILESSIGPSMRAIKTLSLISDEKRNLISFLTSVKASSKVMHSSIQ
jgi:hypothetical protein